MRHPAKYTDALFPRIEQLLQPTDTVTVLDPFAGTGKIHRLRDIGYHTVGIEIEPEWAAMHPGTMEGNALALDFVDNSFDAVVTSPTYGNRMADKYDGRDGSKRNTYRIALGHDLHKDNSGGMQWGDEYRDFHKLAWAEAVRVLRHNGVLILNMKDHIRKGARVRVTEWHVETLEALGMKSDTWHKVPTPGNRFGDNGDLRIEYEYVIRFWKLNPERDTLWK